MRILLKNIIFLEKNADIKCKKLEFRAFSKKIRSEKVAIFRGFFP